MPAATDDPAGAPSTQSAKSALRRELLAARLGAPDPQSDADRCAALLQIPEVAAARVLTAYTPMRGEPDLGDAVTRLRAKSLRVLLPVVQPDGDLLFHPAGSDEEVPLSDADVVIVPAVAADRAGNRLGRGGGSYDRALARVRPGVLVIAVVHASELLEEIPTEPHDRRVGAVLAGATLVRVDPTGTH